MRYRLTWEQCPDCGRSGTNGGCYMVERRGLLWWSPLLVTRDRGGNTHPEHFRTEEDAERAFREALAPQAPAYLVVRELSPTDNRAAEKERK